MPSTSKFNFFSYSINDLEHGLTSRTIPQALRAQLIHTAEDINKGQLSANTWKKAMSGLEALRKRGDSSLALQIAYSREFLDVAQSGQYSNNFKKSLDDFFLQDRFLKRASSAATKAFNLVHAGKSPTQVSKLANSLERALPIFDRTTEGQSVKNFIELVLESLRGYDPRQDPAFGWDWKSAIWYSSLGLTFPWGTNGSTGNVDLTADATNASDGWELYNRRVITVDGTPVAGSYNQQLRSGSLHFVLYNRRSGVLRLFLWRDVTTSGAPAHDRLFSRSACSFGGRNEPDWHGHALFSYMGLLARSAEQSRQSSNNITMNYFESITKGWIVLDFPLAYQKLGSDNGSVWLNTFLKLENSANIELDGNIEVKVPLPQKSESIFGLLGDIAGSLFGVNKSAGSLAKAGAKIVATGQKIGSAGGAGQILTSVGSGLSTAAPVIAGVIAGSQIIRKILDFGDAGGVKYATYEGTISLTGTFQDQAYQDFFGILLNRSPAVVAAEDMPLFYKMHPLEDLGLINLQQLPPLLFKETHGPTSYGSGARTYRLDAEMNYRGLLSSLRVNPRSGYRLAGNGVKIQLIVQRPYWPHEIDYSNPPASPRNISLGSGVVMEVDPVAGDNPDPQNWTQRPAGYYRTDGPAIVGPPMANLFFGTFQKPDFYGAVQLVKRGRTPSVDSVNQINGIEYGRFRGGIATWVFIRIACLLEDIGGTGDKKQILLTYKYDDQSLYWRSIYDRTLF